MFSRRHRRRRSQRHRHYRKHHHPGHGRDCAPRRRHRLHRRLFWWFGATILAVAAVAMLGANLLGGPQWRQDARAIERLAAHQFAEVWKRPVERDRLAADVSQSFGADIGLEDANGQVLAAFGRGCTSKRGYTLRIHSLDEPRRSLGTVRLCRRGNHKSVLWGLVLGGLALWIAVGIISRRLSRPLRSLSQTVRSFGEGDLSQRVAEAVSDDTTEVGEVGRAFNEMALKLGDQLREQKELLAAVSHEVRTPLGRMKVLAELAREESDAEAVAPLLDDLDREIDAVDHLVEQLLASARLEFRLREPEELELHAILQAALKQSSSEADIVGEDGPLPVRGDASLLVRLFANLIENANQHGGGIAQLSVATEVRSGGGGEDELGGRWATVTVQDNGPGFAPEFVERAFASFTRASDAGGGLGLGLSIVARIARAHGGDARVVTAEQDGGDEVGVAVELPLLS